MSASQLSQGLIEQSPNSALAQFQRQRKQDSRARLLAAAVELFGEQGYASVSVEDIAKAADVSRMTFYRHFRSKGDIASSLFSQTVTQAGPQLLRISLLDWTDPAIVRQWIVDLFEMDRRNHKLLKVFVQANAVEPEFTKQGHAQIAAVIAALGEAIPAFALDAESEKDRRRWLEAWLLIFELLDQSNHAALDSGIAGDPLVVDILAVRFMNFVRGSKN